MEKLKLGVIGFGNMGTGHAGNVMGGRVPEMELGAISPRPGRRRPRGCIRRFRSLRMLRNCSRAAAATWSSSRHPIMSIRHWPSKHSSMVSM